MLALQGLGGVMAIAHRILVERKRWLTHGEFVELLSLSQLLPGANVVNIALMVGDRHFGWRGAAAALTGLLLIPLVLALGLAALYMQYAEHALVAGALRGMGAVAVGLTTAMALKLALSLRGNPMGAVACLVLGGATIVAIALLRLPLHWVVPALGVLGWLYARYRLGRGTKEND